MKWTLAAIAALANCAPAFATTCGLASYYGSESGSHTASGERFQPLGMTAAHRTLPFGTVLQVTRGERSVTVRINDRGPAKWTRRSLDLSKGAAYKLGIVRLGVAQVCW